MNQSTQLSAVIRREKNNETGYKSLEQALFSCAEYQIENYGDDSQAEELTQEAWRFHDKYCLAATRVIYAEMTERNRARYLAARSALQNRKERQCAGLAATQKPHRTAQQQWASPLELLANSLTSHAPPHRPESITGLGTG